jgi:uncharacterized coiled-coil protein SlyX
VKKAITIAAASVGIGFLAGACFRLGEAAASTRKPGKPDSRQAFENTKGAGKVQRPAFEDRLARLERDVASQSSGLSELRECSLRTEHSLQKLLLSIDRLITHDRGVTPPDQRDQYPAPQDAIS